MGLSYREKTIKYVIYCVVLLVASLLQNVSGLFPHIGSARCFFLIPVSIILGINEDERIAALLGLFGGFLWDAVSVQHMGFNCIFLMLVCFISSALVSYIFRNTFITGFISSAAAIVLYTLVYWLIFILLMSPEGAGGALLFFYIPSAVYTIVLTPALEALLTLLKTKLNKAKQFDD